MNKYVVRVLEIGGSGLIGVIITIGYQHFFAPSQSFTFVYNGEEMVVTESTYAELVETNETINKELSEAQKQLANLENIESEKAKLESELEEANLEINRLNVQNFELIEQINNSTIVEYLNPSMFIDGGLLTNSNNTILSINDNTYYSENVLKTIFGHYAINYENANENIYIGNKIETEKLPISKAEIYEIGNNVSKNSGIKTDKNGNEFSGVLIYREDYVSYFVNEKYNKMSGIIHVTKDTENKHSAIIEIRTIDKNGNEIIAFKTDEITNLSDPVSFEGIDISGAKIVKIFQDSIYAPVEAVISEAFFYNE